MAYIVFIRHQDWEHNWGRHTFMRMMKKSHTMTWVCKVSWDHQPQSRPQSWGSWQESAHHLLHHRRPLDWDKMVKSLRSQGQAYLSPASNGCCLSRCSRLSCCSLLLHLTITLAQVKNLTRSIINGSNIICIYMNGDMIKCLTSNAAAPAATAGFDLWK